jgi:hypothetical protein
MVRHPWRLLGWGSPVALLIYLAIILGSFVGAWVWIAAPPDTIQDVLRITLPVCLVVFVNLVAMTPTIRIDRKGNLHVDGWLLTRRIPPSLVSKVSSDDGLYFLLSSGRVVRSAAYPPSRAGKVARYPRARVAQSRLYEVLRSVPQPDSQCALEVKTSLRTRVIAAGIGLSAFLYIGAIVINTSQVH